MNKKVIYTSIFGNYDELYEPIFIPDGYDFVIFTDMNLKSDKWKVKKALPLYEDNVRNAKRFINVDKERIESMEDIAELRDQTARARLEQQARFKMMEMENKK